MKRIGKLLTIFILLSSVGPGCKEDTVSPYDYNTIWTCHNTNDWNFESTKNNIIGLWEWKYIRCCGETDNPFENSTESSGLKLEFKEDGTGIVTNDDIIEEFTWTIGTYNVLYSFSTEPNISQLNGQLLFCDKVMMCNASYIDGADNFFEKVN